MELRRVSKNKQTENRCNKCRMHYWQFYGILLAILLQRKNPSSCKKFGFSLAYQWYGTKIKRHDRHAEYKESA